MRKVIAAINMTLDGSFDHTLGIPDAELHNHYSELLRKGGVILYGRITYQLMEYWPPLVQEPSGDKAMDDFAVAIDNIPKIVFSHTLKNLEWKTARLATKSLKEEVLSLKQQEGKDILIGSRSLITSLLNLGLIDELQICVQPIIAGKGKRLFENIDENIQLNLIKTKPFSHSGSILLYYKPMRKEN